MKGHMKHFDLSTYALRAAVLSVVLSPLAGCDSLNSLLTPDTVDYKAATTAPALAVPSDLTTTTFTQRFEAPANTQGLGNAPKLATTPAGNTTEGVPTAQDPYGMHLEYDGDRRLLVVDGRSPDELWPHIKDFWTQNGFVLKTESPTTGIMETDWAENRANIPSDWFRNSVGKLIDFAYSSGTRDRFRVLVERTPNGNTDISITHSAMEEVLTGRENTSSRWEERPRNPQIEAAMYLLLIKKFGLTDAQAQQLADNARPATVHAEVVMASSGSPSIDLAEPFDRTWLRVGLALDRSNFAVDSRDREKGIYYVRFHDPAQDVKKEGLLGKLFYGKGKKLDGKQLMVNVQPLGDAGTRVAVVDANGQFDTSGDAQRIVTMLHQQLN
jgi:outer membrane protein assembly factor BamC